MEAADRYIAEHSASQTEALRWVQRQTNLRTNHARMLTGPVQGRFLTMITRMIAPKNILEIGTFTGYSAICLAYGLAGGCGHIDTLEVNDELEDLILEGFRRAGVDGSIKLWLGDAKKTLEELRAEVLSGARPPYDMVYIDANKREYCEYYNLVFDIVRPGGWILADNVLWDGKVFQEPLPQDKQTLGIAAFNDLVASDPRVENVILPVRDGLNLIRILP